MRRFPCLLPNLGCRCSLTSTSQRFERRPEVTPRVANRPTHSLFPRHLSNPEGYAVSPRKGGVMAGFFGAGLQVIAFVVGVVCLISTILGKPYGIGPVTVPAPSLLLQRVALGLLGAVFVFLATWPLFSPTTSISDAITPFFAKPSTPATLGPPDISGTNVQPWFAVQSERIAIVAVQSRGQSGYYFRNVGTRSIHVQFDALTECAQASCHSEFDVPPIDNKSAAAQDTTIKCGAEWTLELRHAREPPVHLEDLGGVYGISGKLLIQCEASTFLDIRN